MDDMDGTLHNAYPDLSIYLQQESIPGRPLTTYKNCGCLLKDTISIEVLVIKKRRNRCCRKVKNNMWDDNKIQKCYRKRKKKVGI
jgi:hypothetical protein